MWVKRALHKTKRGRGGGFPGEVLRAAGIGGRHQGRGGAPRRNCISADASSGDQQSNYDPRSTVHRNVDRPAVIIATVAEASKPSVEAERTFPKRPAKQRTRERPDRVRRVQPRLHTSACTSTAG